MGQSLPQAKPRSNSPGDDILSALEHWVEDGVAPKRIVAVKYVNDDPAQGVARTRPLCVYPKVAVYDGHGSTDNEANFRCRKPRHHAGNDKDDSQGDNDRPGNHGDDDDDV